MSDELRTRDLMRLVRWRGEPFAVVLASFAAFFYVNVLVHGDPARMSGGALFYAAGWNFLLSISLAILLEAAYSTIRIVGALFQRTGRLWTYSVPALSIFFLIVEPMFSSGNMLSILLHDRSMASSVYLTLLMFLSVLVFLILIYVPVFHGLNAAFLLASILLSRLLLLPLQNLFFPQPSQFTAGRFLLFVVLVFFLASLFYLYLQTRRRVGLSPHYERYQTDKTRFLALLPISLPTLAGLFYLRGEVQLFHPLLDIFYLNLIGALTAALFLLYILLRYEARSGRSLQLPGWQSVFLFFLLTLSTVMGLLRTYQTDYVFFARETAAGRFLELISVLADKDRDGNSFWPGQDPDDTNAGQRREGKGEFRNNVLNLKPTGYAGVDRILLTFVIDGLVNENPVYSTPNENVGAEPGLQSDAPELDYWMQPSNRPERSLRAFFQGLSSFEEVHGVERRSLLSFAADDGYRTLCFGLDDGTDYFFHDHPARLDSGCQVFESLPSPEAQDYKTCVTDTLSAAENLVAHYQEKHNFLWLHIDTRRCKAHNSLPALEQRRIVELVLTDLQTPTSPHRFLADPSRRLLGVIMETGYLPYFYVRARDEFWRAKRGAALYSQILSGHLFFLRWYFADRLEEDSTAEDDPGHALRKAEQIFQRNGASDLNDWVFLQEAPDESVRWFREVIGLQGVERRLPPMMLYYDARRRRLTYSHGMWNRTAEFQSRERTLAPEEDTSGEDTSGKAPEP